jgi:hypothetical protein
VSLGSAHRLYSLLITDLLITDYWFDESVFPHRGLDSIGPGVDAAGEVEDVFVAGAAEPFAGVLGAHAVMAVDDDGAVLVDKTVGGLFGDLGEGNEFGPFEAADLEFILLANVHETEFARAGSIHEGAEFLGRDFALRSGLGQMRGGRLGWGGHRGTERGG